MADLASDQLVEILRPAPFETVTPVAGPDGTVYTVRTFREVGGLYFTYVITSRIVKRQVAKYSFEYEANDGHATTCATVRRAGTSSWTPRIIILGPGPEQEVDTARGRTRETVPTGHSPKSGRETHLRPPES